MTKRITLFAILALFIIPISVYAAVTLKYFRVGQATASSVQLEWETATEIDTAAFILSRSDARDGKYQTLETIPAEGDAVTGKHYQYVDANVQPGMTYWYKLEEQDVNGAISLATDPISVNLAADAQLTPTPTTEAQETTPAEATQAPAATQAAPEGDNSPAANPAAEATQAPAATQPSNAADSGQGGETAATPAATEKKEASAVENPASQPSAGESAPANVPPPPASNSGGNSALLLILGIAALVVAAVIGGFAVRIWRNS